MRISTNSVYDSVKANITRVSDQMLRANLIVSTGKRINKLSDDPVGMVSVLDLRSDIKNLEQLERNITMGRTWLKTGEAALTQVEDILSQVKSLAIQMASENVGSSERSAAAETVEGLLRQVLALANSKVGDRYIFGGTNTDTTPFSFDDEDTPTEVTYAGNASAFSIKIGNDLEVAVGKDGEQIFGDDDFDWSNASAGEDNIFKTLLDLKGYLKSDSTAGIQGALTKLDNHLSTVNAAISDIGTRIIRLDVKENIIADLKLSYTDRMSRIEDADIAEAIMDLQSRQVAYQAALASSSKILKVSLVDYL